MLAIRRYSEINHSITGEALGVRYRVANGLLDLHMQPHQSSAVTDEFKSRIKEISRKEKASPADFLAIHRMSRMCWEMATECRLTNLDKDDADLLYNIRQSENFEWVFKIMNDLRSILRTTSCSIAVADHVAKTVEEIMTS